MTDATALPSPSPAQAFSDFALHPALLAGTAMAGFSHCTPIQAASLPLALAGRDVAGQAQTGTGKTAAFLLATMQRLLAQEPDARRKPTQPRALILAPTRELAVQIHRDGMQLGVSTGLRLGVVYGGTGYQAQREALQEGVDLLVGTPGRLIDYLKQGVFDLKAVEVVVLDEADRMFDLGFISDVRFLMRRMPPPQQRLGLLFSATLSHRVIELAYEHMNDPQIIRTEAEQVTAAGARERLYHVASEEKMAVLRAVLHAHADERTIIFVNTRRVSEEIEQRLRAQHMAVGRLSGDVPQNKRLALLKSFTEGHAQVLVATDVAARGLHIPDVGLVINYDLPQDAEDYVHRIGRTARAGAEGDAVSLCCEHYCYALPEIEAFIGHKIPVAALPDPAPPIAPRQAGHAMSPDSAGDVPHPTERRRGRRAPAGSAFNPQE
jgi:ATP-dependent RNA helicase RhlB